MSYSYSMIAALSMILLQGRRIELNPRGNRSDKGIFERYAEIFSDPMFLVMLVIALGVVFIIYRYFVKEDHLLSAEEELFEAQLNHYGYQFVSAQLQQGHGPFQLTEEQKAILEQPKVKLTETEDKGIEAENVPLPEKSFSFYKVHAQDAELTIRDFWAQVEYGRGNRIVSVSWLPNVFVSAN